MIYILALQSLTFATDINGIAEAVVRQAKIVEVIRIYMDNSAIKNQLSKSVTAEPLLMHDFHECAVIIQHATPFSSYHIDMPHNDILRLQREDITILCMSPATAGDRAMFKSIEEYNNRPDFALCCLSDDRSSLKIPGDMAKQVRILTLPMSLYQLRFQIDNIFFLQKRLLVSEATRATEQTTNDSVKYVLKVSQSLNGIHDTDKLLSLILKNARDICNADAGSLYVVEWQDYKTKTGKITFKITQNESIPPNFVQFNIPVDDKSIVGNSVLHQTSINIPDLYKLDSDASKNPYNAKHNRSWDQRSGYQTRSMLTVPMFDIEKRVIGVIQLINRKKKGVAHLTSSDHFDNQVLPFDKSSVDYAEIIAHQAGIALENAMLNEEKERLFQSFVNASITAVEQRDPHSSGHAQRVAQLTMKLAQAINENSNIEGLGGVKFTEDQLKELKFAALLHDFGKIGINEQVLTKNHRLYHWQLELIKERFAHARTKIEIDSFKNIVKYLESPGAYPPGFDLDSLNDAKIERMKELDQSFNIIMKSNDSEELSKEERKKLDSLISYAYYPYDSNVPRPLITQEEYESLSIFSGVLTAREQDILQTHVTKTFEFLRKVPWGDRFSNVPQIAAKHHEKLDGSGYPTHAQAPEIPIQSRMIGIADMYDDLTSHGKSGVKASQTAALAVLELEAKTFKVDAALVKIFILNKIYETSLDIAPGHL